MSFPSSTKTYGRSRNDHRSASPFDRAKREWDNRIGTARAQAFHWRLIALMSVLGMIVLATTLGRVSSRKDVRTYVVEVDQLGRPARVTLANDTYRPEPAQVAFFIGELIRLVRARPLDPVVVRENWKKAYDFLAGDAVNTMNTYAATDPPLKTIDRRRLTRVVEITNILQKSDDTYQVRWLETDYVGGVPQEPAQRTGLFHVELKPPRNEEDVHRNPLGVYIISFSWSKEFTGPVATETNQEAAPLAAPHEESPHESKNR